VPKLEAGKRIPPTPADLIARRVLVDGRVQGVFFRETCRREASARGVAGWVRNRSDGRVEAVFEGSPEAVEGMVAWCRRGPAQATIDVLEIHAEPTTGRRGFRIEPTA
jgi:acylphosphatase